MIPGEEVSVNLDGGATTIHVNGIGISRVVEPIDATDIVSTLQANVNAILEAGGQPERPRGSHGLWNPGGGD